MQAEQTAPAVAVLAEDPAGARPYRLDQLRPAAGWAIRSGRQLWLWAAGLRPLQPGSQTDPYTYEVWVAAIGGETTSLGAVGPAPGGLALATFRLPEQVEPAAVLVTAQPRGNQRPTAVVLTARLPRPAGPPLPEAPPLAPGVAMAPATAPQPIPALLATATAPAQDLAPPAAASQPGPEPGPEAEPSPEATPAPAGEAEPAGAYPDAAADDPFPAEPEHPISAGAMPLAPVAGAEAPPAPAPAQAPETAPETAPDLTPLPAAAAGPGAAAAGPGAAPPAPPGCVALETAEVPLEPHGSTVPAATATAHLDFGKGALLLTARHLPRPGELGESTQTGRPYNAYRVWLQSSATHDTHAVGIAGRVWEGTFRAQVREGLHLRRFDTILITAEDRAGSAAHPSGTLVLAGRYRWYQSKA